MAVIATLTAVVAGIGAGLAVGGSIAAFSWTAAAIAFGGSLLLSVAGHLLAPKPPSFGSYGDGDFTRQFRQPTPTRLYVYGETRVSGATAFIASTSNNKYLHIVIMLADHEVASIGEILINDISIADNEIDGSGNVTSGQYANLVRIKKHLGTTSQAADSDLVSEVPEWTNNHKLSGIAYIYVRYQYDRTAFPSGIPNLSAYIRGKKIYDPRTTATKYSPNIALIARDYLIDTKQGWEVDSSRIDDDTTNDSANYNDVLENVTDKTFYMQACSTSSDTITLAGDNLFLQRGDQVSIIGQNLPSPLIAGTNYYIIPYKRNQTPKIKLATTLQNAIDDIAINITTSGSLNGTQRIIKNAEPRFYGGGIVKSEAENGKNLQEIISGMAGRVVYAGGKWRILTGKYYEPAYTFTEDDLISNISVTTKKSKANRFNRIKGIYTSPINNGNPSDYPPVKNDFYETEDGEIIERDMPLPFCQRSGSAQRVAKIELERQRQEIVIAATFKLTAFQVQAGDNLYITLPRYGWDQKVFEVLDWTLSIDDSGDAPKPVINMTLQENASAVYDWNMGEETTVDLAANTTLTDPFTVEPVQGFSLDSFLINTQSGDSIFNVLATWESPDNSFIEQGGFYEIEYRRTDETIYKSAGKVDGSITEMQINSLQADVLYDLRIRAFNNMLAASNYATIENFKIGDTVTTNTEDWENETLARDNDDWENDTLTTEDWE